MAGEQDRPFLSQPTASRSIHDKAANLFRILLGRSRTADLFAVGALFLTLAVSRTSLCAIDGPALAPPSGMKLVAYTRVSTQGQADGGVSIEAQRAKLAAYAAAMDLELVAIIDDAGYSAKTVDRPGLARALAMLDAGEADGLLVAKLDRLTRSVRDLCDLCDRYFASGRKALLSLGENVNTSTAGGRMILSLLTVLSQWERELVGERTAAALAHLRATGRVYGHTPLGFQAIDGLLVEDPAEARTVAEVRRLHAEGASLRRICAEMKAAGHPTKKGGSWRPSTVQAILKRAA